MNFRLTLTACLLFFSTLLCVGCTTDDGVNTESLCVKCGGTATTTLTGPADIIEKNGISISECTQITSSIYSAPICDYCLGPVAEIKPDAGFSGETPFY
ncbi:MAG: hypothetical protein IJC36_00300 [Clostridia bacterium]|nr:hypothetical protein [Clostridia bacterium]